MNPSFTPPESRVIHYVEAFDHIELLERWAPLLADLPDTHLVCHVQPRYAGWLIQRLANHPNAEVRGPRAGESWDKYLKHLPFTTNARVLIATLGRRPHWFYSLSCRVPYYVVLHNLNYCFDRSTFRLPVRGVGDLVRDGIDLARKRGKRSLLSRAAGLLYPYERMVLEGRQQSYLASTAHYLMPFSGRLQAAQAPPPEGPLQVVVPGTVINRARDYNLVAAALTVAVAAQAKITLHLAGKVSDMDIIAQLRRAVPDSNPQGPGGVRLEYYPEGLAEATFVELLSSADVLLGPIKSEVRVGRYRELLGITKASGTPFDAVFYGKPLLLPAWHPLEDPAVIPYSSGVELGRILVDFAVHRNLPTDCWSASTELALRERWIDVFSDEPA